MSFFLYKFYLNQNLIKHKILIFSKLKLNKSVNNQGYAYHNLSCVINYDAKRYNNFC